MKNLNKSLISGIDEAGRGSIIGPLVIASVTADKKTINKFSRIGIKDSKKLSAKNREIFSKIIIDESENVIISKLSEKRIDKAVKLRKKYLKNKNFVTNNKIIGLNELEAHSMSKMINNLNSHSVYVDSCDVKPERFKERIENHMNSNMKIYSSHKADEKYVIVAAASIVAKYTRDKEIFRLGKKFGEMGSGYPSDPVTRIFLQKWLKKNKTMPDFTRKSWKTWENLQPKIEDYF